MDTISTINIQAMGSDPLPLATLLEREDRRNDNWFAAFNRRELKSLIEDEESEGVKNESEG